MLKAYKLRPEYEGTLVGGTVTTGPDAGTLDVKDALDSNDGEIVTGDAMLQGILENYYGAQGLMFAVSQVTGEDGQGREALPDPTEVLRPDVTAMAPAPAPPSADNPPNPMPPMPGAVHGDNSEYETFTVDELRDLVKEREVSVPARANKSELIAALENADISGDTADAPNES